MLIPALASILVGLATLPPWLSTLGQSVLMDAFAPFCHQLPARTPHVHGTALAVCDRCIGIYTGLLVGGFLGRAVSTRWAKLQSVWGLLILGGGPAVVDWVGPWLGLWPNTPTSRLLTGLWLGGMIGLTLVHVLRPASHRPTTS